MRHFLAALFLTLPFALLPAQEKPVTEIVYPGYDIPGYGRKVVLISGDQEYRSEETLPQFARILAQHHGLHCRVLFAQSPDRPGIVDPEKGAGHIPGLEALETADLLVLAVRFLDLPDEDMKRIDDYLRAGRPVLGLRTSNHGFQIESGKTYAHYDWLYGEEDNLDEADLKPGWTGGFGQVVFGGKFIDHHGHKMHNATRGRVDEKNHAHPILNGLQEPDIFGPSFVYGINTPIRPGCEILLHGEVLETMEPDSKPLGPRPYDHMPKSLAPDAKGKNEPMMPLAWTTEYRLPDGGRRGLAFHTTMGASQDFECEDFRHLLVNGVYWLLGITPRADAAVGIVGSYETSDYGFRRGEAWQERGLEIASFVHPIKPPSIEEPGSAFLDPAKGRENKLYADHPVNRFRLYDFYSRQAEAMMDLPERPALLPDFPTLDGGHFGHWGAFHKNSYDDQRHNSAATSSAIAAAFNPEGVKVRRKLPRTIGFRLGDDGQTACVFDSTSLAMTQAWKGDFVRFHPHRWGLGHGMFPAPDAKPIHDLVLKRMEGEFRGYHQIGKRSVIDYAYLGNRILEHPWTQDGQFLRIIQFPDGVKDQLWIPQSSAPIHILKTQGVTAKSAKEGRIEITGQEKGGWVLLQVGEEALAEPELLPLPSRLLEAPPEDLWPWTWTAPIQRSAVRHGDYEQDEIPVPHQNPYGAPMIIGGIAFFEDGRAAVTTYMGDVWIVSGLDGANDGDPDKEVTWKRFATGLNHALGIEVVEEKIVVLGRDRLTRLHDHNGDGCADFYESFSEAFEPSGGGHSFYVGLQKDAENNLYFTASTKTVKVSADGKTATDLNAGGQRNPNGVGASRSGLAWTSANEGDWNPASMIWEIKKPTDFCGRGAKADGPAITPPLVFVPRGIDNSTGGQIFTEDDRWGLPAGILLSTSFGNGDLYGILRDTHWLEADPENGRAQGTVFRFPFDFESGTHRGRFAPHDGQLYLVGADGWGNYAASDGHLSRIRYLPAKKARQNLPIATRAHENGIAITFENSLHPSSVTKENFLLQQWRYQFSEAYGCRELSAKVPGVAGHDEVELGSVSLSKDGRTVFLGIPDIKPIEVLHVHARLKTIEREPFLLDTFHTLLHLDKASPDMPGRSEALAEADRTLKLDIKFVLGGRDLPWTRNRFKEGTRARMIRIECLAGLKFDQTEIEAKAGEPLQINLKNVDHLMPHNIVFVKPGKAQAIGEASDKMLAAGMAAAAQKHYVPESDDVLFHSSVLVHNRNQTLYVHAPKEPGDYPYLCTFPGHWGVMRGVLRVVE